MSSVKDWLFSVEEEKADKWIRERLEDDEADEESPEYQELATEYYQLQEYLAEQAEFEAELQWLKENGSSIIHKHFLEELDELKKLGNAASTARSYMSNRMTYAHAVTLLEAFLGDTAKSLISENDIFFRNSRQINELKKARYSLEFLATNDIDAKGLAIKELSNILYHNMPKVKKIFEIILSTRIDIDISELEKIMKVRHDIVHRNGKTKEEKPIYLNYDDILEMISHIEFFSNNLQLLINKKA